MDRLLSKRAVGSAILALACALAAAGLPRAFGETHDRFDVPAFQKSAERLLERTRSLAEAAADFEPRATLARLGTNRNNGKVYRFDEHVEEARLDATAPVSASGLCARCFGFEFDGEDSIPLLPSRGDPRIRDGVIELPPGEGGYLVSQASLAIEKDAIGEIELRIRTTGTEVELAWSSEVLAGWPPPGHDSNLGRIIVDTLPDGSFHRYRVDAGTVLRRRLRSGDSIRTFFLRSPEANGDSLAIDYVRFIPKVEKYAAVPFGRAFETLEREMRAVLYSRSPLALRFDVDVPHSQPRLEIGTGILETLAPVRFSVSIESGGAATELYSAVMEVADRWTDAVIDLAPWAGREASIVFRVESEQANVAFWSNPILYGTPRRKFSVILIVEDTLRADHMSLYGHSRPTSPAKDRFAGNGIVFERAYSQATKTRPSCASFMTSLLPSATGVANFNQKLHDRYLTLAEILRSQGYRTASFVQNSNAGPAAGLHQGFSYNFDPETLPRGPGGIYGGMAVRWMEQNRDRNFFVYLHVIEPHGPYDPPPPFDHWYRREGPGSRFVPLNRLLHDPKWLEEPTVEGRRLLYDGDIRHNDHWFGLFVAELEEKGLLDETLFVFMSDHGEHLGEHHLWEHRPPGFVQVVHVPLFMVHPAHLPAGRRIAGPVQLLDVAPTILESAAVDVEKLMLQGDSLHSLVRGQRADYWESRISISEEPMAFPNRRSPEVSMSFFFKDMHVLKSAKVHRMRVFDHATDPEENRSTTRAPFYEPLRQAVIPSMRALRRANTAIWQALGRDAERVIEYDPEVQDRLRALGYVGSSGE